jgi:hypothetical protein
MSQNEKKPGFFGSWIGKGVILGIALSIVLVVAVFGLGGRVTGVSVGPIQVSLDQNSQQAQALASDVPSNPQSNGVQAQPVSAVSAGTADCPYDASAFWLMSPDEFYYEPGMSGYSILYSYDGFAVWDPNYYSWGNGDVLLFPTSQITYNQWTPLIDGHFDVCVSNANGGAVYARYNG